MEDNRKKLIQLRTKLEFYKKLNTKITEIMDAKLDLEDFEQDVFSELQKTESELDDYKMEIDLPDSEWDEDETKD